MSEKEEWEDIDHVADFLHDLWEEASHRVKIIGELLDRSRKDPSDELFEEMKQLYDDLTEEE